MSEIDVHKELNWHQETIAETIKVLGQLTMALSAQVNTNVAISEELIPLMRSAGRSQDDVKAVTGALRVNIDLVRTIAEDVGRIAERLSTEISKHG